MKATTGVDGFLSCFLGADFDLPPAFEVFFGDLDFALSFLEMALDLGATLRIDFLAGDFD